MTVQLVHLELPFEVLDGAQALDDRLGLPAAGKVDDELRENVHLDVRHVLHRLANELDAILDRERRLLVRGATDDPDDHAIEDRGRTGDHVDVAERDRVVRSGIDGGDQCWNRVRRAEPYVRDVSVESPWISGCSRAPVS